MLRFVDGFDHYTTAMLLRKWTSTANGPTIGAGSARFSGQGFQVNSSSKYAEKVIDAQATWTVGFAFRPTIAHNGGSMFCGLVDAGTVQLELYHNISGTISILRGSTVLATSTFTLTLGAWHYVELKATIHPSAGVYEVRVNGVAVIGPTAGVNTRNTANSTADSFRLGMSQGAAMGGIWDYDDLYLCDTDGSANTSFLGDVRVETLYPSAAGSNTQWTPDGGSNYARVNEATPDDDASYVEDATAGHRDSYAFGDLVSTPSSIFGVQTTICARKTDAGSRSISDVCKSGATTDDGPSVSIGDSYLFYRNIREVDPLTAAAWTAANLNAAEFGQKLVS